MRKVGLVLGLSLVLCTLPASAQFGDWLKKLGLQPIGFADYGHTWNKPGTYAAGPEEGVQDWRANLGFGFGRRFDLPGLGANNNLRMYASAPVGNGREGHGWRFLVAFER